MSMMRDSLNKISKMNRTNKWLFETIKPFLGNRILDAGCGNGNITSFFTDKELVIAVDNNEQNIKDIKDKLCLFKNLKIIKYDLIDNQIVPLIKKDKIDTIVCINTLEHIEDDSVVLSNFYNILQDNGRLIILVPTLEFLYSSLDKAAGHFRRYNRVKVIQKLNKNNFFIQRIFYFNFFGILGWFLQGKILKNEELDGSLLNLFERFVIFSILFEKVIRVPLGLSLLIICRKENLQNLAEVFAQK